MTTEGSRDAIITPTSVDPPIALPRPAPWRSMLERFERRRWTAALAAALLITAVGVGVLYADDQSNQTTIRNLQIQNESLTGRNEILIDQLKTTQTNLTATLGELATTKAELAHPTLTIWTAPEAIKGSNSWLVGNIPDTFTYHLSVTSTGPMSVAILTIDDYVNANSCMNQGGQAYYCMNHSGSFIGFLNKTTINYDFHLAEGCADYLAVFTSSSNITVTPNVSVTYNPASSTTGACS